MRKIFLFIYFIFQVLLSSVNAQSNYPVFVTPTLSPPYSLNLSDYSKFGSQKLMVTIHINDLNISNLPVKLRIKLETTGVTIENPATIATTPIYIDGGSTSILFGNDLTDYFNINNLIFRGYSKETYNRTGQLPEGFYRFSVEVLHFNTNRVISNQGTATAWIALGKPPVLKLPENNAQMGQFKGMPLTFSWLSSNVGSPVSANTIQYKFEMWEMHVPGINPNVVAASMPVFHEHTDFNKLYSLYPTNLLMKPGMQYAWRVTASDLSGFVPFEQNGHSEIRTFIYKAACDSITDLTSSHRGKNGLFSWNPEDNHTSFNVEMHNPKTNWMANSETFENKAEFFDLDYGATYEMRVQAVCDGDPESKSDFSNWKSLAVPTPAPPDTADCPDCVCDDDIPDIELQNFDIRTDLQPGDTIVNKTGTSRFILKTVEDQGSGVYKGIFLFWAEIWKLKFICNYWDLQVNTDDVIVNMDFESIYDPQFLVDVDATIDYLDSLAGVITTLTTDVTPDDTITIEDEIITTYVNAGDSVIVVVVDEVTGDTTEIVVSDNVDDLEEILIEGEDGEEYIVTSDGEVMGFDEYRNTGGGNAGEIDDYNEEKEKNNLSEDITVNFIAKENQKFGFDRYSEEKTGLQSKYPSFNNGYKPAYKSIASFSTDIVGASNSGNNIIFKDEMGIPAIKTGEDITLRGSSNGADVALYAYQVINDTIEKIAGKLNVLSFDEQAKQLYIVPVNGATTPDATSLQNVLNKVYSQAITRWQVTKLGDLADIVFEDENMTHGGTSAISVYNNDQKTIVNTFEERLNKLESNAYYLFFVENVTFKDRSIAGYMPLQRQVGFIYDNPSLNIITHELGHGAFNLWHTFSPDNFIATEHTTQNLMDYKGGTDLWKHQWQLIHDPQTMLFAFMQDESEGAAISDVTLKGFDYVYIKRCNQSTTSNEVLTTTNESYKFVGKNSDGYANGTAQVSLVKQNFSLIQQANPDEAILIFSNDMVISMCEPDGDYAGFCEMSDAANDIDFLELFEIDVKKCRESKALEILQELAPFARQNQRFELYIGGTVYSLNNNTLKEETTSDEDINAGNWTDGSIEMKMRISFNESGILQFSALGIYKNLAIANVDGEQKTARLTDVSTNMLAKNNALLQEYSISDILATPNDVGANLDSEKFPDEKKVEIKKDAAFMKILCEAGGIGLSFLKTAEIEQPVYLASEASTTIKAPPIGTGALEAGAMAVTDITSMVTTIHDLVTDKQARTDAVAGLKAIKDQVVDQPTVLFPILGEVALQELTGTGKDGYKEMLNGTTDEGRKGHLITKTSVRTTVSVFTSGKFLAKLPDMAIEMAKKMPKAKLWLRFRSINDDLAETLLTKFDELSDGGNKFLDDFVDASDDAIGEFLDNPELIDAWKKMDELGTDVVPDALRRNPKLLEALDAPKGSRKAPSTYLEQNYIDNHLTKFNEGSSRIVNKADYNEFGVGKPDVGKTEFVFPQSEMDEILSLPSAEKAKKLGIPESQLDGDLVRIDFETTDKIDIPSGNEFGANDQWIPGGKTDGGVSEAVIKTEGMQLNIDFIVNDL